MILGCHDGFTVEQFVGLGIVCSHEHEVVGFSSIGECSKDGCHVDGVGCLLHVFQIVLGTGVVGDVFIDKRLLTYDAELCRCEHYVVGDFDVDAHHICLAVV